MKMEKYFKTFKKYAFRLELLQEYRVKEELQEFKEFLKSGKITPDKFWKKTIMATKKRGAVMQRVHVVELPLSKYIQFEIEHYAIHSKAGELIYLINKEEFDSLRQKPDFDFWLFDDKTVLKMNYGKRGEYLGFDEGKANKKIINFKKMLLKKAKLLNKFKVDSFSQKIFALVKQIPKGKVTTYGEIARAMNTKAYQAIGNILAKNENGFLDGGKIPCHRVVRSDGTIGGFCGQKCGKKVCEKKELLKKEGIRFDGDKIIDFEKKIYKFN